MKKITEFLNSSDNSNIRIGLSLLQSQEGFTKEQAESFLLESHQEKICLMCEENILFCKSSTSTFLCEGRRCEDASEMYLEQIEEL
jgi:hypothetical protein